jgi:hypothetical protein
MFELGKLKFTKLIMTRTWQTQIHKTHHGPNLKEPTTFPFIVYFVPGHEPTPKCHFVPGLPNESLEIFTIGTPATLGPITLHVDLRLR